MVLTFESVDQTLKCDHSNEIPWVVLPRCAIYITLFSDFGLASKLDVFTSERVKSLWQINSVYLTQYITYTFFDNLNTSLPRLYPPPPPHPLSRSLGANTCYHGGLMPLVSVREICVLFCKLVSGHLIRDPTYWHNNLLLRRLFPVNTIVHRSVKSMSDPADWTTSQVADRCQGLVLRYL